MRFTRSLFVIVLAAVLEASSPRPASDGTKAPAETVRFPFADVPDASGARFVHTNGMSGAYYFSEIIGSGVALLDYDGDGLLDLLVLQRTPLGGAKTGDGALQACSACLFHNDSVVSQDGERTLKFSDVTEKSGLCSHGYGMGIATGDFDNDGF